MKCTIEEQETCQVEKRGCEGCYYNDEIEVEEYIRTKNGEIAKVIEYKDGIVLDKEI